MNMFSRFQDPLTRATNTLLASVQGVADAMRVKIQVINDAKAAVEEAQEAIEQAQTALNI